MKYSFSIGCLASCLLAKLHRESKSFEFNASTFENLEQKLEIPLLFNNEQNIYKNGCTEFLAIIASMNKGFFPNPLDKKEFEKQILIAIENHFIFKSLPNADSKEFLSAFLSIDFPKNIILHVISSDCIVKAFCLDDWKRTPYFISSLAYWKKYTRRMLKLCHNMFEWNAAIVAMRHAGLEDDIILKICVKKPAFYYCAEAVTALYLKEKSEIFLVAFSDYFCHFTKFKRFAEYLVSRLQLSDVVECGRLIRDTHCLLICTISLRMDFVKIWIFFTEYYLDLSFNLTLIKNAPVADKIKILLMGTYVDEGNDVCDQEKGAKYLLESGKYLDFIKMHFCDINNHKFRFQ